MRNFATFVLAGAVAALAGTVPAQTRPQLATPIARPAAVNAARAIDTQGLTARQVVTLAKKTRALEGRVATLEAALREQRAASEFTCSTDTVSRNGRGATEDCSPYACNYLDGRCRTTAQQSGHCAPGFYWNGGNQCIPPPPPAPDDDCVLGIFC